MTVEQQMAEIYEEIDVMLCESDFEAVDGLIQFVQPKYLETDVFMAYLGATIVASDKLKHFPRLLEKCRAEFTLRYGEDEAQAVFRHLD